MDLTMYFGNIKATKKVVEELNQTINGHAVVKKLCKEQNTSTDGLRPVEAAKMYYYCQEEDPHHVTHYERGPQDARHT